MSTAKGGVVNVLPWRWAALAAPLSGEYHVHLHPTFGRSGREKVEVVFVL